MRTRKSSKAELYRVAKFMVGEEQYDTQDEIKWLTPNGSVITASISKKARQVVAGMFGKTAARPTPIALRKPEKVKALMKKSGFALLEDGSVAFWPMVPWGPIPDYRKKPRRLAGGFPEGDRACMYAINGNDEKVVLYKALLDKLIRFNRSLKAAGSGVVSEEEAVSDATDSFDGLFGEAKTKNPYMSPRFRKPRKEIGNELIAMRSDVESGKFDVAMKRFGKLEELVFVALQVWEGQSEALTKRRQLMRTIMNAFAKNREEIIQALATAKV